MKRPVQPQHMIAPEEVSRFNEDNAGHYIVSTVLLAITAVFLLTLVITISLQFWVALAAMALIIVTLPPILLTGNATMRENAKVQSEPLPHYWQSMFQS